MLKLKNPAIFLEIYALVNLYNQQVEAAKAAESEGGETVTPKEMLGIALAVVVPALQKFVLPTIPRDTIQAIASALEIGSDRLEDIREQAASILDKAQDSATAVMAALED
ncbi:MAG: hypothetical protein AAFX78_03520 [Cyanobacteria bacterium J06638_20]